MRMNIKFVAGFDTIVIDLGESRSFYKELLGVSIESVEGSNHKAINDIEGLKRLGLSTLQHVARSVFDQGQWPIGVPIPQETIEFDAEDEAEVVSQMKSKGAEILQDIIKGRTVGTDDCVPLVSRGTAYRNNVDSLATQLAICANLLR